MRVLVFVTLFTIIAVNHQLLITEAQRLIDGDDAASVQAAIAVRCGDAPAHERRMCEADLREAFAAGTSDAQDIVRLHCTQFENGWVERRSPSPICANFHES